MPDLSQYDPVFQAAGAEWNINPTVLRAIAGQESGGKPGAVSPKGAVGLMQIMPDTAKYLGMTDATDPVQSIWGAAKYLSEAQDKERTADDALRYYHGGPDWRQKYGPESAAYAPAVGARFVQLAKAGNVASDAVPDPAGSKPPVQAPAPSGGAPGPAQPMSDEEFLKATAGPETAGAKGGMPDADFLEATGAKAAPTPSPPGSAIDPYSQQPNDPASMAKDTAPLTLEGTRNWLEAAQATTGTAPGELPIARGGVLIPTALGVLDVLQGRYQIGESGNPLTVRPTPNTVALAGLTAGNPLRFGGGEAPPFSLPGPAQTSEAYPAAALPQGPAPAFVPPGAPRPPAQLLEQPQPSLGTAGPAFVPPNVQTATPEGVPLPPQPASAPGVPGSVGAAASREGTPPGQIELSPGQMKANRRQAEMAEVNAPPQPNDTTVYVPGSNPTLAQRAGNPATSQQETLLMQRNPEAFTGEGGVLTQQNKARVKALEDATPSDTQVQGWRDDRAALAKKDSEAVLANAKPADLQPAVDYINGILNDPRIRENPDVVATMTKLRDGLFNADGSLKNDPQAVWGMHDRVINMMAKAKDPLNATGAEKFSFTQLDGYKQVLDGVMNAATGNHFQTFLDHYAELSKQINAGELLNKFRQLGATNAKGDLMANRFHKFVSDLAYSRGKPGLDPSMDIPDDTMQALIGIDSDLKRAGQIDLGKARGSPTNLFGALAADLGIGVAHLGMVAATGGNVTGNFLLQKGLQVGQNLLSRARLRSLTNKHLAPPPGGYTQPPNYLNPQP